jgi:peptidoglycan/LPS O-acetylase OafA/YrhL
MPEAAIKINADDKLEMPRIRLDFLDGIRGLAAPYVVIHHAYMEVAWWQAFPGQHIYHGERLPEQFLRAMHFLTSGQLAVDTFIVLSGYCLMLPIVRALSIAATWFLSLFSMGMLGASINFDQRFSRLSWINAGSLTTVGVSLFVGWVLADWFLRLDQWMMDTVFGLSAMCMIVYCTRSFAIDYERSVPLVVRFLESRICAGLGIFSYSPYLIHAPILALVHMILRPMHLSSVGVTFALIFVGVPLCIGSAYIFHLFFERPFMHLPLAHQRRTAA